MRELLQRRIFRMTKKKDIPKSQLRRIYFRCLKCNSTHVFFNGHIFSNGNYSRICVKCKTRFLSHKGKTIIF